MDDAGDDLNKPVRNEASKSILDDSLWVRWWPESSSQNATRIRIIKGRAANIRT